MPSLFEYVTISDGSRHVNEAEMPDAESGVAVWSRRPYATTLKLKVYRKQSMSAAVAPQEEMGDSYAMKNQKGAQS